MLSTDEQKQFLADYVAWALEQLLLMPPRAEAAAERVRQAAAIREAIDAVD